MKKIARNILITIIVLLAAFIYYYITLPAINIHSIGTWMFVIGGIVLLSIFAMIRKAIKDHWRIEGKKGSINIDIKASGIAKIGFGIVGVLLIILVIGSILSSPIVNAKKYQELMVVEEGNFTEDISQVDYSTIPILDKDSAALLGDRKMGSMVDMVSQFEVSDDYTQINVNNRPVRVTPLVYASPIKWLTNQSDGIPAYIKIDMALVRGIDKDPMRQALLKGLVEMANHTSFELIAEGIETEDELELLMKLGIDYGQGYLLERPGRNLMPIRQSIQKKITDSSNNELKRNIWNGKKYVLSQVSVQDYHAIDAYSKKFGENQLSEVFHMLFDIVRKSLSVFDGMYIVDENVCVIIMEKERFPEFSERIAKRFDELLSVLYLENELNQRSMDEVGKDKQELPLLSVQIELIE